MGVVVLLSFTSAINPTLIAVTTVMLLLPRPERLMLGYWLGAMTMSITLGLVILFALNGSATVSTTQHTLSPAADLVLGALSVVLALILNSGEDRRLAARRARRNEAKKPPRWEGALRHGNARTTFVIGALLTLPGFSYLLALGRLHKLDYPAAESIVVVIAFNLVMLILLEAPMIAFVVAPDWTPRTIDRTKAWAARSGRRVAVRGLLVIGVALVIKGIIGLLI
jgi:Sap, sulfolipid-1-addressing protein